MTENSEKTTHFGFKQVAQSEKQALVYNVFEKVAEQYDLMNDVMTGGMHRIWKDAVIDWAAPPKHAGEYKHLDVAGGTADIAFRMLEKAGKNARSTVCDINEHMLKVGEKRAAEKPYNDRIDFTCGNAETLSFEDNYFDIYTIAFGIRNVTRMDVALKEAFRVLKPGGRFLCLEVSKMQIAGIDKIYDAISMNLVPKVGELIVGDAGPYKYLVESTRKFPPQEKFAQMIRDAGFSQVDYRNYLGGVAAIHSGYKI
ncbi:MAG: bifunctional demethylmenaquinone methyltransferase/2-methoxy-6-polyprenyl-1,4-benzoquinol methylase UbiE [Rhizobiales bacterium]|nr:bifunctional demethylmenaquinone methyltransferase/2-methoxy-6-polyprenyl-1,4-benzoquinol methylase UbiE [Hyphomicrobiales bacterium]